MVIRFGHRDVRGIFERHVRGGVRGGLRVGCSVRDGHWFPSLVSPLPR